MAKLADNTAYCLHHGWVEVVEYAELVPGRFVPVCPLCSTEAK